MFESLSERLTGVFKGLGARVTLDENNINEALREVRLALLEADVNFTVVRDFTARIKEKCLGQELIKGASPVQHIVKQVNDELIELLGGENQGIKIKNNALTVIMLVGLQGSGKTTSAAKLAGLLRKDKNRPYLVPVDVYRPAAIEQLHSLAKQLNMPAYPSTVDMKPRDIVSQALEEAKNQDCNVVLLDTAGRLHIDEELMNELSELKNLANPQEIFFVADAMTGQDVVQVADTFHKKLNLSGVILTKMDGDARGGAALSIRSVTGASVKYVGVGEKLSDIEIFHPDRVAGRILGMGDMLTLLEKAQSEINQEEAEKMAKKLKKASFDLEDFKNQMKKVKSLGSMESILKMIPGLGGLASKLGNIAPAEKEMNKTEAIINSMTMQERQKPEIINPSRKQRIAKGSGVQVADVNNLLKQFEQMRKMMSSMLGKNKMPTMNPNMLNKLNMGGGGLPGLPGMSGMDPMSAMPGMPRPRGTSPTKKKHTRDKKKKKR